MAEISKPRGQGFRRILLKLSGEALAGGTGTGIDMAVVQRMCRDVKAVTATGIQVCLVIGGGNIFRGVAGAAQGLDRGTADYMGMLATVMNSLALQGALEKIGVPTRVLSAIAMPVVCEAFNAPKAKRHLSKGRTVIFAAGTGNPFFTTDTTAALRAAEMGCDAIFKATQVDGVYAADPKHDPAATRYDALTYGEVLARDLKVMDGAAIALARDSGIPIIIFSNTEEGNLLRVLEGQGRCTIVRD